MKIKRDRMHLFWAEFKTLEDDVFRYDTRIYLDPIDKPEVNDTCIGAIVGKNPGSASSDYLNRGIVPIRLDGDKLLPTVRNIVLKAHANSRIDVPLRSYIQVLNLFYLCDPNLSNALTLIQQHSHPQVCIQESNPFPWLWYVWGGENNQLSPFKHRFQSTNAQKAFYFDPRKAQIIENVPGTSDFAKHTQGLKHELIVPYLSSMLAS